MLIRGLTPEDIPEVLRVQKDAYRPELLESAETFLHKLNLFPEGCLGCFADVELGAYVFSHPWTAGDVVPLDHPLTALPKTPDCLYIHDLAVATRLRGQGVGAALLQRLLELAERRQLRHFGLVAVQDSEAFWQRWGFEARRTFAYVHGVAGTYMTLTRGKA